MVLFFMGNTWRLFNYNVCPNFIFYKTNIFYFKKQKGNNKKNYLANSKSYFYLYN